MVQANKRSMQINVHYRIIVLNVSQGRTTLVVEAHSADVIATLLDLKKEVESKTGLLIKMTITGATEAHLLASEIASSNVGLIVNPSRPFPDTWERHRMFVFS